LKAIFRTQPWTEWVKSHDADVQTPEPETEKQAWVPGSHADQRGPEDPQPAAPAWQAASGGERRLEIGSVGMARPGAGAPGGFGLPPSSRITRPREIRTLLGRGRRKKTSRLDVFFLSSDGSEPRVGFVVPKHHRKVVDRNRVKRRLRELLRTELLPQLREEGLCLDVLIRARKEAYEASYRQLRRELQEVTEELCSGPSSWR
jgi:ribonuclease P protein component